MNTTQITISFQGAPTPQQIAAQLRFQAGLLEGMEPKLAASRKNTDGAITKQAAPEVETTTDEDDDFAAAPVKTTKKTAAKKAAASFEDEDDSGSEVETEDTQEAESDDEDFMQAAPAKEAKKAAPKKKLTVNDVNDACKAKATASNRKEVLAILKKKFNVTSVTELKNEQYADVIAAMKV